LFQFRNYNNPEKFQFLQKGAEVICKHVCNAWFKINARIRFTDLLKRVENLIRKGSEQDFLTVKNKKNQLTESPNRRGESFWICCEAAKSSLQKNQHLIFTQQIKN
jgi:hypothetical protein